MDGTTTDAQEDGPPGPKDAELPEIIEITPGGNVILDVIFETSQKTLQTLRKAARLPPGQRSEGPKKVRVAYRVELEVLQKQSKYFSSLLGDARFEEANAVAEALRAISLDNTNAADLDVKDLPWIKVHDDDEATRSAGREAVFAEFLRILHGKETTKTAKNPPSLQELATLAIFADRFVCERPVSSYLRELKFKFPQAQLRASREDGAVPKLVNEESVRQKILVSWFLDQPLRFHVSTRELILAGSSRWSPYTDQDATRRASWWDLPDDLESKPLTIPLSALS